jgi:predicted amidohydrolase YtcJ
MTKAAMHARKSFSGVLMALSVFLLATIGSAADQKVPDELAPDLILVNGKVLTFDDEDRVVEAVAIKGNRILAVGSSDSMRRLAGGKTEIVDAGGRLVMPGLVDAHSHTTGVPPDYLDLYPTKSITEIVDAVREKAEATPEGQWIVGSGTFMVYSGWDDTRLQEQRWVTRQDLDPVSPNHPVLLIKDGGHAVVLNSHALRLAGITKDTPDPKGQIVRVQETGELTGAILKLATAVASEFLPAPTEKQQIQAALNASDQLLRMGTTTVADSSSTAETIPILRAMYERNRKSLVSTILDPVVPLEEGLDASLDFVRSWQVNTGFGDENIKLGSLKFFVDGGVTSRTAWFSRPYKGRPDYFGLAEVDKETLFETVRVADRLGWQLHFHTCGDAAAELVLQALEAAQKENPSRERRHLMTHLYVLSQEQMGRMRRLGVVAVLQPNFVYALGEHMRAVLAEEQLAHLIPFRGLLKAGVPVALSADGHPQEPLYGVYAAVVRETKTGHVLGPKEAVSVMEALRSYTRTSAYARFEEERRGSLEAGKLADLVVLDRDIRTVPPDEIKETHVLLTVKDGKVVFNDLGAL